MKKIILIQTYDGVKHTDHDAALRHLDRKYGEIMAKVCHEIFQRNYLTAQDYIDENLFLFNELIKIRDDTYSVKNNLYDNEEDD